MSEVRTISELLSTGQDGAIAIYTPDRPPLNYAAEVFQEVVELDPSSAAGWTNLRGADSTEAVRRDARCTAETKFPKGFDPEAAGAMLVEDAC